MILVNYRWLVARVVPPPITGRPFTFLDPSKFSLDETSGIPMPAIDPDGDLIPIVDTKLDRWAVWSLSQNRAILHASGSTEFQILFNKHRNLLILHFDHLAPIYLIDPATLEIVKEIRVGRASRMTNLSPSGRLLCMVGPAWVHSWDQSNRPLVVDLDTGKVHRERFQVLSCYFNAESGLIVIRPHEIFEYDLNSHCSTAPPLMALHRPAIGEIGRSSYTSESLLWSSFCPSTDSVLASLFKEGEGLSRYVRIQLHDTPMTTAGIRPEIFRPRLSHEFPQTQYSATSSWEYFNPSRNLWIAKKHINQDRGSYSPPADCLIDMMTGREVVLPDSWDSVKRPRVFSTWRFVNPTTIGGNSGAGVAFYSTDELLERKEPIW